MSPLLAQNNGSNHPVSKTVVFEHPIALPRPLDAAPEFVAPSDEGKESADNLKLRARFMNPGTA
jgi:hypothetical protein